MRKYIAGEIDWSVSIGRMVSSLLIACAIGNVIGGSICIGCGTIARSAGRFGGNDADGFGGLLFFLAVVLFIAGLYAIKVAD
jgi:hypothetical protein